MGSSHSYSHMLHLSLSYNRTERSWLISAYGREFASINLDHEERRPAGCKEPDVPFKQESRGRRKTLSMTGQADNKLRLRKPLTCSSHGIES